MKKSYLIAAFAIGLASCTNDEMIVMPQADTPIEFKAVSKKASRSAMTSSVFTGTNTNVYVAGLLSVNNPSTSVTTASNFFANSKFTSDNSGTFKSEENWPSDGKLTMWGYVCTDYTRGITEIEGANVLTEVGAQVVSLNDTEAVWANNGEDKFTTMTLDFSNKLKGNTDVMYSTLTGAVGLDCTLATKPSATMNFIHSLAWVTVNFNTDKEADYMKIYGVQLTDAKLSGKLVVTANSNGDGIDSANWIPYRAEDASEDAKENVYIGQFGDGTAANAVSLGAAKDAVTQGILVIPGQQQTKLIVTYVQKNSDGSYTNPIVHTLDLSSYGAITWEAGKRYLYTINVNPEKITFSTHIESWDRIDEGNQGL